MITKPMESVLIEFDDEAVGVLLKGESGRFELHVVHPALMHLHGESFKSVQAAQNSVAQSMHRQRQQVAVGEA